LQGIVDVSRIDSGAIVPKPAMVDITELCEKLARDFRSDESLETELVARFENIETVTDPVLFSRVVRNILSNARKFVPAGGKVEFSLRHVDGEAVIEISDNGPGIHAENLERIFNEYVQLETPHNENPKGLGLGLAIVKRLCLLLDIEMLVDSEPGTGTRFIFKLPIEADGWVPKHEYKPAIRRFDKSHLVVIVDDDPSVLASMTQLISNWNCQVISATKQQEAIQLVSRTSAVPVLLIIDKQLDYGEHGLDLVDMLREEVNETVPAILMSGQMGNIDSLQARPDIEFLNKPVEPDDIWTILDRIVSAEAPDNPPER